MPSIFHQRKWAMIERPTSKNTTKRMMNPPIVGVPAFALWSFANSVAFPESASSRIFFPRLYRWRSRIKPGISKKVITLEITNPQRINIRLEFIWRKIREEYIWIFIFASEPFLVQMDNRVRIMPYSRLIHDRLDRYTDREICASILRNFCLLRGVLFLSDRYSPGHSDP